MSIREIMTTMDYGPAPESADEALAWLQARGRRFGLFIDGAFQEPATGRHFATVNPATEAPLAEIADAGSDDVDAAVDAARRAQPQWAALGGGQRSRHLYALARHLQKHQRLFAVLETLDNGKTIRESRDIDLPLAIRHFLYHAGWAAILDEELPGCTPMGVCGQIVPWNFPLLMLAWKIAPALATGNTLVLKPAEQTSLTALLFAEICCDAGLPKGVVNIVTGAGETGAALVAHPGVDKIAFTGSTEVGRLIRRTTAGSGKGLTLELGGKSPFIVFDDADLDSAVEGIADSIWFNQGQVCCAGSRLLVQEGIAERFTAKLQARLQKLRLGDPLDKAVDMGPIVSAEQCQRIAGLVDRACADGAVLTQAEGPRPNCGFYYPPTLLTRVDPMFEIAQEEVFGPVLVAMTFRTPDEAVALANNSRYGLAASIWSESINLALDIAPKVEAGVVWVNSANRFDAAAGFGGIKESGYGREGGREGLMAYLRPPVAPQETRKRKRQPTLVPERIDRTAKVFIGGKQLRPDGGYSRAIHAADGSLLGHVGEGNRKDIRNAVEAARGMTGWTRSTAHNRAQVLYYLAENLAARTQEFAERVSALTGFDGASEVDEAVDTLIRFAGWADKYDGAVRGVPAPGLALQLNEPVGVIGILCPDERPLARFVELIAPALALGNRVVVVPSESGALAATDFYQVVETSDLPAGALNIVTGDTAVLGQVLARHADVDMLWFAAGEHAADFETASAASLKRTWMVPQGPKRSKDILAQASQSKTVWIPFGE
ncbi:MAG: aldehyde dehydrogenase family protein [Rhodobacteraceae bacterium]|nr:aldehyde dehydrogenase family protein [Paracoccaceae bacterium]